MIKHSRLLRRKMIWALLGILWTPLDTTAVRTWTTVKASMATWQNADWAQVDFSNVSLGTGIPAGATTVPTSADGNWTDFRTTMATYTAQLSLLQSLNMTNTNLSADNVVVLLKFLSNASQLATLIFDRNPLNSPVSPNTLTALTGHSSTLQTLSVQGCSGIRTDLWRCFIDWTTDSDASPLKNFSLAGTPLTVKTTITGDLGSYIGWGNTLENLSIAGTNITLADAATFLGNLISGGPLKSLDISTLTWSLPLAPSPSSHILDLGTDFPSLQILLARGVKFTSPSPSSTGARALASYTTPFVFPASMQASGSIIDITGTTGLSAGVYDAFVGTNAIIAQNLAPSDVFLLLTRLGAASSPPSTWALTLDLTNCGLTIAATSTAKTAAAVTPWYKLLPAISALSRLTLANNALGNSGIATLAAALQGTWSAKDTYESVLDLSGTLGSTTPLAVSTLTALAQTGVDWVLLANNKLGSTGAQTLYQYFIASRSAPLTPLIKRSPLSGIITSPLPPLFLVLNAGTALLSGGIWTSIGGATCRLAPGMQGAPLTNSEGDEVSEEMLLGFTLASISLCADNIT